MDIASILYLSFLVWQLYALAIHFYHPTAGSSAPGKHRLVILLSLACGALTFGPILSNRDNHTKNPGTSILGLVALSLSGTLFIWTAYTTSPGRFAVIYGKVTPRYVISSGPFVWARHPTYTSYALGWIGAISLAAEKANTLVLLGACICLGGLVWLYGNAASLEEEQFEDPAVKEETRKAYRRYKEATAKWIPLAGSS